MVVGFISCLALGLSSALIWVGTTQLMVQFLLGSEIIFQIISRFGLAKLQNEGGALKNKI